MSKRNTILKYMICSSLGFTRPTKIKIFVFNKNLYICIRNYSNVNIQLTTNWWWRYTSEEVS